MRDLASYQHKEAQDLPVKLLVFEYRRTFQVRQQHVVPKPSCRVAFIELEQPAQPLTTVYWLTISLV
jgi:hypothetical protein